MLSITKLPDGSGVFIKVSKVFNLSISVGPDWNIKGKLSNISNGNINLFI